MPVGQNKINKLSSAILPDVIAPKEATTPTSNNSKRNQKLIARYYYYLIIKKKGSADVLLILSSDFNISTKRISDILDNHSAEIKALRHQSPSVAWFRKQYPLFNW